MNQIFLLIFYKIVFTNQKMHKISYCQRKKITKKKLFKDIKVFLKNKRKKNKNTVLSNKQIYQRIKHKSWLSIEKKLPSKKTSQFN